MDNIKFFKTFQDFYNWLKKNYNTKEEQWIGYYKKGSGKESITWQESVKAAICFGWIDGLRKSIDEESYKIRFTTRNPKSNWSKLNIKNAEEMIELGLMQNSGLIKFKNLDKRRINRYSFEQKNVKLDKELEKKFKENKTSWKNFQSMSSSYKKTATWWIKSAKQEQTQLRRLKILIDNSEKNQKIPPLRRPGK